MKKITLSAEGLAAIIAVTILQACAGVPERPVCQMPRFYSHPAPMEHCPPHPCYNAQWGFGVWIQTPTSQANLRYTINGDIPTPTSGIPISASFGWAYVYFPYGSCGQVTLKAIAYKPPPTNWASSPIKSGCYVSGP